MPDSFWANGNHLQEVLQNNHNDTYSVKIPDLYFLNKSTKTIFCVPRENHLIWFD